MSYQVKHTETTNPSKPPIVVEDQTLNNVTDLTFVGKNYAGYAPVIAENLLHLLENFAKNSPPQRPVEGQLWYDNSAGVNLLKVYDGTNWVAAGSVKKASSAPSIGTVGDLWVNTNTQQLHIYSGSAWILIGPQFSSGSKTGPDVETIVDTYDIEHSVFSFYANNNRIAILSKEAFVPKSVLTGFSSIGQGLNLSSVDAASSSAPTKFWGTASKADALVINGTAIASTNFLRTDIPSVTNSTLGVRSNGGITVGADLSFNIGTDTGITNLSSKNAGNSIAINLNKEGTPVTVIHIDSTAKVGIGEGNTAPAEALDVLGNIVVSNDLIVSGTSASTNLATGSLRVAGGVAVTKTSTFGDNVTVNGKLYINNLDSEDNPVPAAVLLPGTDAADGQYDIGSSTRKFGSIYANSFVGAFNGSFTGSLAGSISGSASKLASPTTFRLIGDVSSDDISFDGQTPQPGKAPGLQEFTTTLSQSIITTKPQVTDSKGTDLLLVYRSGTDSGLKKITKQAFIANIPTVPIGAIMPFAGSTAPAGYLLCDGSEQRIGDYPALFAVIGYAYKRTGLIGKNTFGLPDLRGRFPLGRDDMDNGNTVISITDPTDTLFVDAGGGPANNTTSPDADILGNVNGKETVTLDVDNLPEHSHTLQSASGKQYFAVSSPSGVADGGTVQGYGLPNLDQGYGLPDSGPIADANPGVGFSIMNPYQTINYIIFTGVL